MRVPVYVCKGYTIKTLVRRYNVYIYIAVTDVQRTCLAIATGDFCDYYNVYVCEYI